MGRKVGLVRGVHKVVRQWFRHVHEHVAAFGRVGHLLCRARECRTQREQVGVAAGGAT